MTTDSKTAAFLDYMSKVRLYDLTQRLNRESDAEVRLPGK